ncbi:MAG: transporter substrate-binding domain-containing protein [Rhizobiaceae bacterium]
MTIFQFLAVLGFVAANAIGVAVHEARAQDPVIPNFLDRHERFQRPDLSKLIRLKFLTTTDFPPFNFIDRKKRLAGFHVDLARAICSELDILPRCQIQALPWDELLPAISGGEAEALIAGLEVSEESRKQLAFTRQYLNIPARFITRKENNLEPPAYRAIFKKLTGVVKGSSQKTYFEKVFSTRKAKIFDTREAAFSALKAGEIDTVFVDAISASFWLQSTSSDNCCDFLDGAFMSPEFFGNGMAIAVSKDRPELAEALNFALYQINAKGKFAELYLRYFPLGLF